MNTNREIRLKELGAQLLNHASRSKNRLTGAWMEKFFERMLNNEDLRIQTLRFIDVLPTLGDDEGLISHLKEYFASNQVDLPWGLGWLTRHNPATKTTAIAVRKAMNVLAGQFMGGAEIPELIRTIHRLRERNLDFSLDLLGEAVLSEDEAKHYQRRYLELIAQLPQQLERSIPPGASTTGADQSAPALHFSIKLSSLYSQTNHLDPKGSIAAIAEKLKPLLVAARHNQVAVCFDMEHYEHKQITIECFKRLLMEPELKDWIDAGIALQAYLRETQADIVDLIEWTGRRGTPMTVRLVRGAYWDLETIKAKQHGWANPVWQHKGETDACYERCSELLLRNFPRIRSAIATHNPRSICLAMTLAEEFDLGPEQFEFQMLYGMSNTVQDALRQMGYRLRVYVPFGEPIPGMAYLVRRLLENSSSQSIQRMTFRLNDPAEDLFRAPLGAKQTSENLPSPAFLTNAPEDGEPKPMFGNEPVFRFTDGSERSSFSKTIERVRNQLGATYGLVIDGNDIDTGDYIDSVDPARPDRLVGRVAKASRQHADTAIQGAATAYSHWSRRPPASRARILIETARLLREYRMEFAAWEIFEAGKTWPEADANVAEAIDFLEYYAHLVIKVESLEPRNIPGESNRTVYRPRGTGVIIPPWNFPLAILAGMLSAAIVSGNTVVLKPSSQTPVIAARFVTLLGKAGLPPGVVQFLPGRGSELGDHLVSHPAIHFIAFTGSREIGMRIVRLATETPSGQSHVKHVVAEMGGKNAIIVDSDADRDEAVPAIVQSAFGYQGQKCSACSRVIVIGDHYDRLLRRLINATRALPVGLPENPGTFIGPVIESAARDRINRAIEQGQRDAVLALRIDCAAMSQGYYVGPAIFSHTPPDSPLGQEEIFGPVVALISVRGLGQAIDIANATDYALTGGFFSRSPANIDRVTREFDVGNLYINRPITGALVERQPFGGFKMSGLGSKAGGPDYLRQFMIPRTITEQTLRRGFAPRQN